MHAGAFTLNFLALCFGKIDEDARGMLAQAKTIRAKKKWCTDDAGLHSISPISVFTHVPDPRRRTHCLASYPTHVPIGAVPQNAVLRVRPGISCFVFPDRQTHHMGVQK